MEVAQSKHPISILPIPTIIETDVRGQLTHNHGHGLLAESGAHRQRSGLGRRMLGDPIVLTTDTLHSFRVGSARVHILSTRLARLRVRSDSAAVLEFPVAQDDDEDEVDSGTGSTHEKQVGTFTAGFVQKSAQDLNVHPVKPTSGGDNVDRHATADEASDSEPLLLRK
jgi:hypothetical protein